MSGTWICDKPLSTQRSQANAGALCIVLTALKSFEQCHQSTVTDSDTTAALEATFNLPFVRFLAVVTAVPCERYDARTWCSHCEAPQALHAEEQHKQPRWQKQAGRKTLYYNRVAL